MAKKELKMHAVVAPTETVVVSAYDKDGKAETVNAPIIYDEEQVRYLEIGQKVSDAFKPGTEMKKAKGGKQ